MSSMSEGTVVCSSTLISATELPWPSYVPGLIPKWPFVTRLLLRGVYEGMYAEVESGSSGDDRRAEERDAQHVAEEDATLAAMRANEAI